MKLPKGLVLIAATTAVSGIACAALATQGYRVNTTHSGPYGVWRIDTTQQPQTAGELVSFCPALSPYFDNLLNKGVIRSGECPGGYAPFIKSIGATAGDTVTLHSEKPAEVNGHVLLHTQPLPGFEGFKPGTYTVPAGEVWVFSSYSDRSLDSRYFGPIKSDSIRGQANPVWVLGDASKIVQTNEKKQ